MAIALNARQFLRGLKKQDQKRLGAVRDFANRYLGSLKRRSGESYAQHGLEVASTLREGNTDPSLLAIAVLHDLPVHPDGPDLLRECPLTEEEKALVERMHGLRRLHIDANTEDLDVVVGAFTHDPRLFPLRMAHRLNDVRNLRRFETSLQRRIAHETLTMYAAMAGRLGMQAWRREMEDDCFPIVHPKRARVIEQKFRACKRLDHACLSQAVGFLHRELRKNGVPCSVDYRIKGRYSTYLKMLFKNRTFEELTDRLAIRVVVNSRPDCYLALAVIHAVMHPIPGKLKDYIGAPKENGYQSIHTVIYPLPGVTEQPIEIQIRSEEMHRLSEYGPSSHGDYKSHKYAFTTRPARVNLFKNLKILREESRSPKQFEEALRSYFREDHIAVFDHENHLYHLPKPATVVDFVFSAFPLRSVRLKDVKLNGRWCDFDVELHDGDIVEPRFGRAIAVKKDWLHASHHRATHRKISFALKAQSLAQK